MANSTDSFSIQQIISHNRQKIAKKGEHYAVTDIILPFILRIYCILTEIPSNDKPRIRNIYTVSRIRGLYKRNVVEPRGVEPLSEDQKTRASPSAVCILTFPPPDSHRRDSGFSSFIKSHRPQSLRRLVPCFYDADDLRRRRLRVDDRRLKLRWLQYCSCQFILISRC